MLVLQGVSKAFDGVPILDGIDLEVGAGEFAVFVGPSGCGKSTLLRTIAGLERADAGEVFIDGVAAGALEPAARRVAMVFQSYALYPHMNVRQNMGFALKMAGKNASEIETAVDQAAETLDIKALLDRKPKELSGGQRQRVAIGRAIVRDPKIFLFDEPLSNLDAGLRVKMRYEFSQLHKRQKTTTIYVTHDQVEAMTLADRIIILNHGRIEQQGRPAELYASPCNMFVAQFIGSPKMNMFDGVAVTSPAGSRGVKLRDGAAIPLDSTLDVPADGASLTLGVRPEHWVMDGAEFALAGTVAFIEELGNIAYAHIASDASDDLIICQMGEGERPSLGQRVRLGFGAVIHLFDSNGVRIGP